MKRFAILILAVLCAGVVFGQTFTDINTPEYWGKTGIKKTHAVLDASFAKLEGGVTLSATATAADTWGIDASHPSATGLYATVELLDSSVIQTDTDYVSIELFEGVNSATETVVWAYCNIVVDDNTTNTEDTAIELYQPVAGVNTKVLDISAGVVSVPGALGVTGVMTLTAAPVLTAITASGTATALTTNAPAITEETPVWVTVSYGGSDYVMPIWLKD